MKKKPTKPTTKKFRDTKPITSLEVKDMPFEKKALIKNITMIIKEISDAAGSKK